MIRVTIDDISPDEESINLASLVTDDGRTVTLPLDLLPEGADVGEVLKLTIEIDHAETRERHERVAKLQKRLFGIGFGAG